MSKAEQRRAADWVRSMQAGLQMMGDAGECLSRTSFGTGIRGGMVILRR